MHLWAWHCFRQRGNGKQVLAKFYPSLLSLSAWHKAAPVQNIPEDKMCSGAPVRRREDISNGGACWYSARGYLYNSHEQNDSVN